MRSLFLCTAFAALTAFATPSAMAQCGNCKPADCGESCCGSCEPSWLCCQAECKMETIKKHCYEVECDYVCIPPVRLPECRLFGRQCGSNGDGSGQSCCDGCGGEGCQNCSACNENKGLFGRLCSKLTDCRIRKVNKLKKKEYEVEVCVCEWDVVCCAPPGCCSKGCGDTCAAPPLYCAPCGE